jgi:hypothetical protein
MIHLDGIGQQVRCQHRKAQSLRHFVDIAAAESHPVMTDRLQIDRHRMLALGDQIFEMEVAAVESIDQAEQIS